MKAFLALGVVAFVVVSVQGEVCNSSSDCTITQCNSGGTITCVAGTCTCTSVCSPEPDLARCRNQNDCRNAYNNGQIACTCQPLSDLHCIDGQCHCGYPTGN
uniref:SI-1 n=1 Tax=Haliotis discus hannai TaxID=42344 RepID=A0A7T1F0V1_HALDH|nr:SI-1 [Haliotis discus hannai]